jgi:deoxycytidylate deaminase
MKLQNSFLLAKAISEALKSSHKHKVGSVIFDKKRVFSTGRNYPSKSVKHLKNKFKKWNSSIHAEVDAIIKAKRDLKGMSMLIVRVSKSGLALAKPCKYCLEYCNHVGIKNIYYSNELGEIERLIK